MRAVVKASRLRAKQLPDMITKSMTSAGVSHEENAKAVAKARREIRASRRSRRR